MPNDPLEGLSPETIASARQRAKEQQKKHGKRSEASRKGWKTRTENEEKKLIDELRQRGPCTAEAQTAELPASSWNEKFSAHIENLEGIAFGFVDATLGGGGIVLEVATKCGGDISKHGNGKYLLCFPSRLELEKAMNEITALKVEASILPCRSEVPQEVFDKGGQND